MYSKKTRKTIFLLFLIPILLLSMLACIAESSYNNAMATQTAKAYDPDRLASETAESGMLTATWRSLPENTRNLEESLGIVHFDSAYEPVQVSIEWPSLIPNCIYYQANAQKGVHFNIDYDLETHIFTGIVEGTAHADEYGIWESWGEFDVYVIEGTVRKETEFHGYTFSGTGALTLKAKEQAMCGFQLGDSTVTEVEKTIEVSPVTITGRIQKVYTSWQWSPTIIYDDGSLKFYVKCINCVVE